jgi:hypothetical protein
MAPERTESPPVAPRDAGIPAGRAPGGKTAWLVRTIVIAVSAVLVVAVSAMTLVTFLFQSGSPFL